MDKELRKPLPPPDGAPFLCSALVPAPSGPPYFGQKRCGEKATHMYPEAIYTPPRCDKHEGVALGEQA